MWRWPNGARLRFAYLECDAELTKGIATRGCMSRSRVHSRACREQANIVSKRGKLASDATLPSASEPARRVKISMGGPFAEHPVRLAAAAGAAEENLEHRARQQGRLRSRLRFSPDRVR